jgi:hypothetical protein
VLTYVFAAVVPCVARACAADRLVELIMTADVLAHDAQCAVRAAPSGGIRGPRHVRQGLALADGLVAPGGRPASDCRCRYGCRPAAGKAVMSNARPRSHAVAGVVDSGSDSATLSSSCRVTNNVAEGPAGGSKYERTATTKVGTAGEGMSSVLESP